MSYSECLGVNERSSMQCAVAMDCRASIKKKPLDAPCKEMDNADVHEKECTTENKFHFQRLYSSTMGNSMIFTLFVYMCQITNTSLVAAPFCCCLGGLVHVYGV